MNWFQRHLNWAVIIAMCVIGFVSGFLLMLIDPDMTDEEFRGMSFLIGWVAQFPVFGWMLVQKNRRLWNLLWLIIPVGWLILLCLKNRSEQKALEAKETESKVNKQKEKHEISTIESQEEEYKHSVWEIYRREWATASPEKRTELNKRMLRWQELMKNGWTATQAYYRVMEEQADKSPSYSFSSWRRKAPFVILGLALVAAIVYCVVITRDRDALNTELESVQSVLASTEAELSSTKQTLASTQAELDSLNDTLASMQAELNYLNSTLASVQNELEATKANLEATEAKLRLYEETLGVKVFAEGSLLSREMKLVNNSNAANPTWQELKAFLLADPTDDKTYIKNSFDCDAFAAMLHNNAEAKRIKAAFVGVYFRDSDIGHALNAFKTTDKGLVYVDCTGGRLSIRRTSEEWDKIAYVGKGKEYGLISLGKNTPIDYDSYEKMKADYNSYVQKLEAYNKEVEKYNREIFGKVYYIGTAEWFRIEQWQRSLEEQERLLDNLRAQLEYVWEEDMGIVESIEIYW